MTNSVFHPFDGANCATAEASLEFGRFRVLLRQRLLLADGVPIELGTRAFELLLALLEDNGALVTKVQLLARVWPGIVVAEDNLKVQVSALRRALGEDRNLIRTEFGRGYRFTAAVRSAVPLSICHRCTQPRHRSKRRVFPQRTARRSYCGWPAQANLPRIERITCKTTASLRSRKPPKFRLADR
jgi:DNA-binding winged helix-turn-helix (wHTH) protein